MAAERRDSADETLAQNPKTDLQGDDVWINKVLFGCKDGNSVAFSSYYDSVLEKFTVSLLSTWQLLVKKCHGNCCDLQLTNRLFKVWLLTNCINA